MEALYSDLDAAEDNLRLSKEKDILIRTLSDYMAILSPFKDSLTTYLHELENTIRIDGVWERYIQERRNCWFNRELGIRETKAKEIPNTMTDRDMVLKKYMNTTQDAHSMASAGNDENTTGSAKREGDAVPQCMKRENNMVGSATRDGNVETCAGASSKESVTMRKRKRRPSSTGSMDDIEEHPPIAM
jgi:hypothetical protein